MKQDKVELLAPAGSPEGARAAIRAGADALYLGGEKFGARAYAQNFTEQDIIDLLFYAHIRSVKIYLTVNTLMKNEEIQELETYLRPLVCAGLDAVIVQDCGAIGMIHELFPDLSIHASTQMTITTSYAMEYLKNKGVERFVPARELSAAELHKITEKGYELEVFIHGSMCYCYSGQCLFSSMLGERSGNRGRCAQPCRLPYGLNQKNANEYLLSMKDMCTIQNLPDILDTGISSLKIEGRMKSPQYSAGVTSIYRKYLDMALKTGKEKYHVDDTDMLLLSELYVRTKLQNGYYYKMHGKDMITLDNPSYAAIDKNILNRIDEQFVLSLDRLPVDAEVYIHPNEEMKMKLLYCYQDNTLTYEYIGEMAQTAQNKPLSREDVIARLQKTGDTGYYIKNCNLNMDDAVFASVKQLNELRRNAFFGLDELLRHTVEKDTELNHNPASEVTNISKDVDITDVAFEDIHKIDSYVTTPIIVFVRNIEQLEAVCDDKRYNTVVLSESMIRTSKQLESILNAHQNITFYAQLDAIVREEELSSEVSMLVSAFDKYKIDRIYCNQIDQVCALRANKTRKALYGDYNLYCSNDEVEKFFGSMLQGYTVSTELTHNEMKKMNLSNKEIVIYGNAPLMNTANCVALTSGKCTRQGNPRDIMYLNDRQGAQFLVELHCDRKYCYNTIYNSVPTSLHKHISALKAMNASAFQIRFTTESSEMCTKILDFFDQITKSNIKAEADYPFTNGHFHRSVL